MPGKTEEKLNTKERLLDAAEKLFAARGFDGVGVRDITSAAGAHLAAVNYHFGGKKPLYKEVFRRRWIPRALRLFQPIRDLVDQPSATVEEVVATIARAFIEAPLDREEFNRHRMLVVQEMLHPSEALQLMFQEVFQPSLAIMSGLFGKALGGGLPEEKLKLYSMSVMAMVQHFIFVREASDLVMNRPFDQTLAADLIDHIVDFSLNGLGGNRG